MLWCANERNTFTYSMNVCYSVQQSEQTVHFSALTKKAGLDKSCFIFTTVNESDKGIQNRKTYETSCWDITLKDLGKSRILCPSSNQFWVTTVSTWCWCTLGWCHPGPGSTPAMTLSCLQLHLSYFYPTLRAFCRLSSATHLLHVTTNNECECLREKEVTSAHRTFKLFLWRGIIMTSSGAGNTLPTVRWDELCGWQSFRRCRGSPYLGIWTTERLSHGILHRQEECGVRPAEFWHNLAHLQIDSGYN